MPNLKELSKNAGLFTGGHRACAGCAGPIIINQVLSTAGKNTVVSLATGCMEVTTTIFPYTAWGVSYMHIAFENVAAGISGVEAAYRALKNKGKFPNERWNFIAFAGDGGTYDIGLQALSGALERGQRFLYICYDNEAYMNTGIQRSSATPKGADTTTSPSGKILPGKHQHRKDLTEIVAAHNIPYVAQASPSHWADLTKKVEKALNTDGPSFINVLSACPLGWKIPSNKSIAMSRLAVETNFWPLYEVENGEYKINYKPRNEVALEEWLKVQGRFAHLFNPEVKKDIISSLQEEINKKWDKLIVRSQQTSTVCKQ